jgi:hypothetical protein
MSIIDFILKSPSLYIAIMIILTLFYTIRGIVYFKVYGDKNLSLIQKIIIEYIQEILFKIIITISSFISLYLSFYILSLQKEPFNEISTGTSALIIFLFMWGIIGISGYLTHLITVGKPPH